MTGLNRGKTPLKVFLHNQEMAEQNLDGTSIPKSSWELDNWRKRESGYERRRRAIGEGV